MLPISSGGFFATKNFHVILVILAAGPFLVSPAFADIIDVGIEGRASGSGDVTIACEPGAEGCVDQGFFSFATDSFSFDSANKDLGTFSQSGQASALGTGGRILTAGGLVQQTTEASPNSFSIDLVSQFTVDQIDGGRWAVHGFLSNSYSMFFTLTTESSMHLKSELTFGPDGGFFDGADLFGPGISVTLAGLFEQTLTLEPGSYEFDFLAEGNVLHGPIDISNPATDDSVHYSLNAKFTTVPEPHWTPFVPGLLGIGYYVVRKRRRRALFTIWQNSSNRSENA